MGWPVNTFSDHAELGKNSQAPEKRNNDKRVVGQE